MKPRLLPREINCEDWAVWCAIRDRDWEQRLSIEAFARLIHGYEAADRRDAALMWSMVGIAEQWSMADRHELLAFYFGGGPLI